MFHYNFFMEEKVEPYSNPNISEILALLYRVPLFTGVGITEQRLLAHHFTIEYSGPDELIIEQCDVGDKLYIIIHGSVTVSIKTASMGWKRISTLREGDVLGEIAILRNIPRTARITTLSNCKFLTIRAQEFLKVYQYFTKPARDNIQLIITKRLQQIQGFKH